MNKVVCSFQGAFGPPTCGHLEAMNLFAKQVLNDYKDALEIIMLFMPTGGSGSKKHLQPTQDSRLEVLRIFCYILKNRFHTNRNVSFIASDIEIKRYESGIVDTSTYRTINDLKLNYPRHEILLAMGYDNMLQLPYWANIETYKENVTTIYVSFRQLTEEEERKTANFKVGENILRFETSIPRWGPRMLDAVNDKFSNGTKSIQDAGTIENAQTQMDSLLESQTTVQSIQSRSISSTLFLKQDSPIILDSPTYNVKLPNITIIGKPKEKGKLYIPATSSSMMRYYIWEYITNENKQNIQQIKKKILNIMFGKYKKGLTTENLNLAFNITIDNYILGKDEKWFTKPNDDGYDKKYKSLLPEKKTKKKGVKPRNQTRKKR
jgi:nicotinic acid mononucleotide adenylyltransferase